MKNKMKRFAFTAILMASMLMFSQTAFCEAKATDYFVENGTVIAYVGIDNNILVPNEELGQKIDKVGIKAFAGLTAETIALEKGITAVEQEAFAECPNLVDFQCSSTLTKIGDMAFRDCPALVRFTLPDLNIAFGKDVFKNTGFINFVVPCDSSYSAGKEQALLDRLTAAKGDNNFAIEIVHDYEYDGKDGGYICSICGDTFDTEDGRDPSEISEDNEGPNGAPDIEFIDVTPEAWYHSYISIATQFGLLNGKGDGYFKPDDNITIAEAAKIAACAREYFDNTNVLDTMPFGENWYDKYMEYCKQNGIIEPTVQLDPTKPATRAEIAYIFSRCDTHRDYINEVPLTDIPDVDYTTPYYEEILDMFNLGAAVGSDANYTFHPNDNIKRSEAAAMIVRIICYDLRIGLPKG